MKKFLLSLAAVALASSAWATDTTFDFVNSTYDIDNERGGTAYFKSATATNGNVTIEFSSTSGNGFRFWSDGLRLYKGDVKMTVKTIDGAEISAVNINCVKALGNVSVNGNTPSVATVKGDNKFNCNSTSVDLAFNVTANNAVASLTVTYGAADTRQDPDLSFPENAYSVKFGEKFEAPVLGNPHDLPVKWESSNEGPAHVDENTGEVTVYQVAGTTTITASFAGNDTYKPGTASYTLTVVDPNAVTFDFVNETYGMTRYSEGTDYNTNPVNITEGVVTLTIDGGNNRLWADGLRMYNGCKATISVETGYKISSVTYDTADANSFSGAMEGTKYVISYTATKSGKALKTVNVSVEDDIEAGVDSINVDANAPKEYYNLQGVRVANPEKGLYIVRQGGKTSKVIL